MRGSARSSLVQTVTLTIILTSTAAMLLQFLIVAARTYLDDQDLMVTFVSHEVSHLADALKFDGERVRLRPRRIPRYLENDTANAYAFRILLPDRTEIASHNGDLLEKVSPWSTTREVHDTLARQDMWVVNLDPDRRLHLAGGQRVTIADRFVLIEVATLGDPEFASAGILMSEALDDVWVPMIPLIVLTIGATIISVRRSLRPLAEMSALAEDRQLASLDHLVHRADVPREVEGFVSAIGRLILRVRDLLDAQRSFVARAAHELRTPLAAITLEVERPEGPDKARLQSDIALLGGIVDQLLVLARLETSEIAKPEELDLEFIAEEVIEQTAPIARRRQHAVVLTVNKPTTVVADANSLQHALRNLLLNALHHTPPGTAVAVTLGPGAQFCVADSGPGWGSFDTAEPIAPFRKGATPSAGTGLGLSIVRRAADVLGGNLTLGVSDAGGARVVVDWRETAN